MGSPGDVCAHLLCLADAHLQAQDPVRALGPCLRCLSAAEASRLLKHRAEALVRIARVRLEMRDLHGALQLAEEVTPQLGAGSSAKLRGEALVVQADVLLSLLSSRKGSGHEGPIRTRILREVVQVLRGAAAQFQAVAEINQLRRCHYLLARSCHELGDTSARDSHAGHFRRMSEFLLGARDSDSCRKRSWDDLGLGRAAAEGAGQPAPQTRAATNIGSPVARVGFEAAAEGQPRMQKSAKGALKRPELGGGIGGGIGSSGARCPALDELLALAEGDDAGGEAILLPLPSGPPFAAPRAPQLRSCSTPTAVGHLRTLYPMAVALRA